jgi:hypothetical protein
LIKVLVAVFGLILSLAGECPKWNKPPNNSIIDNIDKENKTDL